MDHIFFKMKKIKDFYEIKKNKTFNKDYYMKWLSDLCYWKCKEFEKYVNITDTWWDRCKKIKGKKIRYWSVIPDEDDMYL